MQPEYSPDGWLGIILGSKIFINFTKYTFDECVKRLKTEISSLISSENPLHPPKSTELVRLTPKPVESSQAFIGSATGINHVQNQIQNWTETDVHTWLEKSNFCQELKIFFNKFNGEMLFQTIKLRKEAPEYFYRALSQEHKVPFDEIIKFTIKLDLVVSS
jgi:hypothetical protein